MAAWNCNHSKLPNLDGQDKSIARRGMSCTLEIYSSGRNGVDLEADDEVPFDLFSGSETIADAVNRTGGDLT